MLINKHRDLISIIIPVYNIETYIEKCLQSVCTQTYRNIEIIIVNDGSTDSSDSICKNYENIDKRIKYIYQDNGGSVAARMTGLNSATGKYIVFVDGDDTIDADHLEILYGMMMEYNVDFVHTNYSVDGCNQLYFRSNYMYKEEELTEELREQIVLEKIIEWRREREIFECNLYGSIYKKGLIYECYSKLPKTQSYGEDLLCLVHLVMKCGSAYFGSYSGYNYTLREGSLCRKTSFLSIIKDNIFLYDEMYKVIDQYGLDTKTHEKLRAFFRHKFYSSLFLLNDTHTKVGKAYTCPFIDMLKGQNIAVYCAGAVGRDYYKQFIAEGSISVVVWVDKDYVIIDNSAKDISDPLSIRDKIDMIDYVVIAINNRHQADEIKDEVHTMGVDERKLLWQQPVEEITIADYGMSDF